MIDFILIVKHLEKKGFPHLNKVVLRIAGAEWSFEEQIESIWFFFGLNELIVLLAVQGYVALTITPCILKERKTTYITDIGLQKVIKTA